MPLFKQGQFAHLKPDRTAKYTLPGVSIAADPVVLELKYSGETNKRYQSALAKVTLGTGQERARQFATLLSRYASAGWSGVVDHEGRPVPFSSEALEELLHMIIDESETGIHFMMPIIQFAADPSNFREPTAGAADLGNG